MDTYFDFQVDQSYLWRNFEEDLCKFDHEGFMNTYDNIDVLSESFMPSEFFGLEDEVSQEAENLVEEIRECFTSWVRSFDFSEIAPNYQALELDTEANSIAIE